MTTDWPIKKQAGIEHDDTEPFVRHLRENSIEQHLLFKELLINVTLVTSRLEKSLATRGRHPMSVTCLPSRKFSCLI
jgi:hypothetical protein